jgi:hypothetical protein
MGNDPHNIKTFIGAEEWKVVKCVAGSEQFLCTIHAFKVSIFEKKNRCIVSLFNYLCVNER